jgi:D-amino peptidase
MKVFITVDLEGISGVYAEAQTDLEGRGYKAARELMRADLDAALEGCFGGGATEIVVNDSHDLGSNLSFGGLPSGVTLVSGSPSSLSMVTGLDATCEAMLCVGYHARAGTAAAVLEHTYSYKVFSARVDGEEVGEIGLNAAVAGHFGVPLVFVSGDDKTAAEAGALVPGVRTAIVKTGDYRTSALLLAPDVAHGRIQSGVTAALRAPRPALVDWRGKRLEVTFTRTSFADLAAGSPGAKRLDGRTVAIDGADYLAVFTSFVSCLTLAAAAVPPSA